MNRNRRNILTLLMILCTASLLWSQNVVGTTGGEATGVGGTMSYTVGQVAYTYSSTTGISIDGGVQQPFEVNTFPVELLYFSAIPKKRQRVLLSWSTASELNNDFFTVLRTKDGQMWEPVLKIQGAGTSQETKSYEGVDESPYRGRSYYRLRQTDFDGGFTYSEMKSVKITGENELSVLVYPNPSQGQVLIALEEKPQTVLSYEVSDELGHVLLSGQLEALETELSLSELPKGIYVISILQGLEFKTSKSIIKTDF